MSILISTNPSRNFAAIGHVVISSAEQIACKVMQAQQAKTTWAMMPLAERISLLRQAGKVFAENLEQLAQLTALEMGMPITAVRADIADGLVYWNYCLDQAPQQLASITAAQTEKEQHRVHFVPFGVVACIAPWNYPFSIFVWQCGQALTAGNVIVFKHSEETPLLGQLIEELLTPILPVGVFQEVYGGAEVGECLVQQAVDLICFTGSSATGAKINQLAASRFIPTNLEMGGSAPGIIFADSDISAIEEKIYQARFANSGQSCDALKRLIVHESKFAEVVQTLEKMLALQTIGDASDAKTTLGPLVAERQVTLLEAQVADALAKGAKLICGGKRAENLQGAYYLPTLLSNISTDMRVWREEVFGPILPIVTFTTEAEAIALANDTIYGLGAYIFTQDVACYQRVAQQLVTCMVAQNNLSYCRPENFFGGCKASGNGRTNGVFGFAKVTQTKLIVSELVR